MPTTLDAAERGIGWWDGMGVGEREGEERGPTCSRQSRTEQKWLYEPCEWQTIYAPLYLHRLCIYAYIVGFWALFIRLPQRIFYRHYYCKIDFRKQRDGDKTTSDCDLSLTTQMRSADVLFGKIFVRPSCCRMSTAAGQTTTENRNITDV